MENDESYNNNVALLAVVSSTHFPPPNLSH